MGTTKQSNIKVKKSTGSNKKVIIILSAVVVILLGFFVFKPFNSGSEKTVTGLSDLTIPKANISETVTFYPYNVGKTNMEVLAVKAPDGTIRTALNTCQVCYDSGKGYYKQQGSQLVCQNCGNKFSFDKVEKVKGGCNPVPIMDENKKVDGTNIVISKDFLEQNKDLFGNWKKQ